MDQATGTESSKKRMERQVQRAPKMDWATGTESSKNGLSDRYRELQKWIERQVQRAPKNMKIGSKEESF